MAHNSARIALAVGFGSGVAGVVLTLLLTRPAGGDASNDATSRPAQPSASAIEGDETSAGGTSAGGIRELNAGLAMELAQLSERLGQLEARMSDLQRKPAEGYVTRTELEQLLAQLRTVEAALDPAGLAPDGPEAFKQDVLDAVRTVEKERASAKYEATRQARIERVDRDVASAGKLLDLTPSQEDNLRNALLASYEREEQVLRLWREGAGDEVLGTVKQENHDLLQTELGAFMTHEQLGMFNGLAGGGGK